MFADELAGNPAKKRADEARARRLRAKREGQAKQRRREEEKKRASASTIIAPHATQNATSNSESKNVTAVFNLDQERNASSHITNGREEKSAAAIAESLTAPELSATEKAAEQRKLRAEQRVITRYVCTFIARKGPQVKKQDSTS